MKRVLIQSLMVAAFAVVLSPQTPALSAQASGYRYTSTSTQTGGPSQDVEIAVWSHYLRMTISESANPSMDMRFNSREKLIIASDHRSESYFLLDEATIRQISEAMAAMSGMGGAVAEAMKAMEGELSEADKERMRAMGIPGMGEPPAPRVASKAGTAGTESTPFGTCTWHQYKYDDGELDREFCLTDQKIDGFDEARAQFLEMADFMSAFRDIAAQGGAMVGGLQPEMVDDFRDLENYPVIVREYQDGELRSETRLESVERATFTDTDGGPIDGYKRQEMGMNLGR